MIKHILSLDNLKFQSKPTGSIIETIVNNIGSNDSNQEMNIEELLRFLTQPNGQSWSMATYQNGKKDKENWISQGYFALDIDSEDMNHPDPEKARKAGVNVKRKQDLFGEDYTAHNLTYQQLLERCEKYGVLPCGIHNSFSSNSKNNQYRVIFQLNETVTNSNIAKAIQYLLFMLFPESDKVCATDVSRFFFGGRDILYENPNNILDVKQLFKGYKIHLEENYKSNMEHLRNQINEHTNLKQLEDVTSDRYMELIEDGFINDIYENVTKDNKMSHVYFKFGELSKESKTTEMFQKTPSKLIIGDYDKKWLGEALPFIDAESFELWYTVGMALKQEYGDTAKEIFIDWSKTAKGYSGDVKIDKDWNNFKPDGSLTIGSIKYIAQRNGWDSTPDSVKKFNLDHFQYIDNNGRELIYKEITETRENSFDKKIKSISLKPIMRSSFLNVWEGIKTLKITTNEKEAFVNRAKFWLKHEKRRIISNVVFEPKLSNVKEDEYNIWNGFAIDKIANKDVDNSKFDLYFNHLTNIIANGDKKVAKYILGWMAFAVQHPEKLPGVALILIGQPGTGKSLFVELFAQIFGRFYMCLQSQDALTGRFNSHLAHKVLVFADEAIWKGDIKALNKLKNSVTNSSLNVEKKYQDITESNNYIHIVMASNDRTVLRIEPDDRRFCIVELNSKWAFVNNRSTEKKKELKEYFTNMVKQFNEDGGLEHFFGFLKGLDIKNFDITDFPETLIKDEHKINGLDGKIEGFVYEILDEGMLYEDQTEWKHVIKKELYNKYLEYIRRRPNSYPVSKIMFFKEIKKILNNNVKTSRGPINRISYNGTRTVITADTFMFNPLPFCRKAFTDYVKFNINWDDIKETETIKILDFGEENTI